jgi:putative Holliday junction resolvase
MTSPTKGRVLGVDVGRRRIGLAVSDATGTLARPLTTLTIGDEDAVTAVAAEAARLERDDEGLSAVVVGLPVALDGTPTNQTRDVAAFIDALRARTTVPVVSEDERLTSREAESRLALRERDWRKRKARLDAAAAAIILQDYLDRTSRER